MGPAWPSVGVDGCTYPSGVADNKPPRRFARDVAVNVVANLITAAILYMVGVLVGLVPTVHGIEIKWVEVSLESAGILTLAVAMSTQRGWRAYVVGPSGIFLGLAGVLSPFASGGRLETWSYCVAGAVMVCLGVAVLWKGRRWYEGGHPWVANSAPMSSTDARASHHGSA